MQNDITALEPRFQQPGDWTWHYFSNHAGHSLRFGTLPSSAPEQTPRGVVVILPGLSEFGEKYFELARDMVERNFSVYVMDWRGQGRSHRHLPNPHCRYSSGFETDVSDLHQMIAEHIRPSTTAPLIMIAHSMGGNIGMRYLSRHHDVFSCAAFSAPMLGIRALRTLPMCVQIALTGAFNTFAGTRYIHGGGDWSPDERKDPAHNIFSSDPVRGKIHNTWSIGDTALRVGNASYGWLYEAVKSCAALRKRGVPEHIKTPSLFACAGLEKLVDNNAIHAIAARMPNAKIIDLPNANHEILMERDDVRSVFIREFDDLLADTGISPTPQP